MFLVALAGSYLRVVRNEYEDQVRAVEELRAKGFRVAFYPKNGGWLAPFVRKGAYRQVFELDFDGEHITAEIMDPLTRVFTLSGLGLTSGCTWDAGQLEKLSRLKHLRGIDFSDTNFGDADLEIISRLPGIDNLCLDGTKITDDGLRHLAKMPQLTSISLGRTSITDAGLAHLVRLPKLDWLSLADTPVSDAGLPALGRIATLKAVELAGTRCTEAGCRHLRQMLPYSTVVDREEPR
jgi:hypothetical protein